MTPQAKRLLSQAFPEIAARMQAEDIESLLKRVLIQPKLPSEIIDKIKAVRGERGEKGEKGDEGKRGESVRGDRGAKGDKGDRGIPGIKGERGPKGEQGIRGGRGEMGIQGVKGDRGNDGKSAVFDVRAISDPLNKRMDEISNTILAKGKIDQRWHGGGLSRVTTDSTLTGLGTPASPLSVASSGGLVKIMVSGTVNGSNQTFTVTKTPTWLIVDGAWYEQKDNNDVTQWSAVGATITTQIVPSDSIWGF